MTDGVPTTGRSRRFALVSIAVALLLAAGMGWAGSQGGGSVLGVRLLRGPAEFPEVSRISGSGVPIFALAVLFTFLVQWIAFVPSWLARTEQYYDLVGSLTYFSVTVGAFLVSPVADGRPLLLAALVVLWAGRLGFFLFRRVRASGGDSRFDEIKRSFLRFLAAWTLQGLWVTFTLAAALAAITTLERRPLGVAAAVGTLIWLLGFSIEVTADAQKRRFKEDPGNEGEFIREGLWAWSRHPNYFGEIVLWTGIAIVAAPVLRGWQGATLVSPLFVYLLLTRVSGIPPLEEKADERWGGSPDYEDYKERTPVLVPRAPGT